MEYIFKRLYLIELIYQDYNRNIITRDFTVNFLINKIDNIFN